MHVDQTSEQEWLENIGRRGSNYCPKWIKDRVRNLNWSNSAFTVLAPFARLADFYREEKSLTYVHLASCMKSLVFVKQAAIKSMNLAQNPRHSINLSKFKKRFPSLTMVAQTAHGLGLEENCEMLQ